MPLSDWSPGRSQLWVAQYPGPRGAEMTNCYTTHAEPSKWVTNGRYQYATPIHRGLAHLKLLWYPSVFLAGKTVVSVAWGGGGGHPWQGMPLSQQETARERG